VYRIFILSPAKSAGRRAEMLFSERARFDLARRLQKGVKAPLSEIFSFLSGLYFRGKILYARHFGRAPEGLSPAYVITSSKGLMPADQAIGLKDLRHFSTVEIDPEEPRYVGPLRRHARALLKNSDPRCEFVLLGSIGTRKYAEVLIEIFGERLQFPSSFVGRGDMSRGGLLLRSVAANQELEYIGLKGAVRHGKRPSRLEPRRWAYKDPAKEQV
jgi:hypothetical protein